MANAIRRQTKTMIQTDTTITASSGAAKRYLIPFILVTSLFFLWGIANSMNGTLIKHFQTALNLNRAQAGIVDSAFYIGYFVMALPAAFLMNRIGYKKGIIIGLLLYVVGALLFYPAAEVRAYSFFPVCSFCNCLRTCIFRNGRESLRNGIGRSCFSGNPH